MKKPNRKEIDAQCLRLWSLCIRTKQRACRNCNSDYRLQGHHIIARPYKRGRYAMDNGLCLCSHCHFLEKIKPEEFRDMVISVIGQDEFRRLKEKYMGDKSAYKRSLEDLQQEKQFLKDELKRLEAEWGKL